MKRLAQRPAEGVRYALCGFDGHSGEAVFEIPSLPLAGQIGRAGETALGESPLLPTQPDALTQSLAQPAIKGPSFHGTDRDLGQNYVSPNMSGFRADGKTLRQTLRERRGPQFLGICCRDAKSARAYLDSGNCEMARMYWARSKALGSGQFF